MNDNLASSTASSSAAAELPRWRPLRTLRFAIFFALGFTLLNFALTSTSASWSGHAAWARALGVSLVFALLISFTIDLLFVASRHLLGRRLLALSGWRRNLYY
ncbi:MAG TPA: hypothetical protein VJO99_18155, partial [Burkholderiaceae bacterium]|nr:hypothetical protein [Burkholderiaceae bacterium]